MRTFNNSVSFPPNGTMHVDTGGISTMFTVGSEAPRDFGAIPNGTGKALFWQTIDVAPFLRMWEYDYSNDTSTLLTLSGFGTLINNPGFQPAGWDSENSIYWLGCVDAGGSAELTSNAYEPMTVSGTTITLGTGIATPAVADHTALITGSAYNGKIVVPYYENTSFLLDECRVYDVSGASWAAPSGGNPNPDDAYAGLSQRLGDNQHFLMMTGGQANKTYMMVGNRSLSAFLEFDFSTESWTDKTSTMPVSSYQPGSQVVGGLSCDPSGNYILGCYRNFDNYTSVFVFDRVNDVALLSYTSEIGRAHV